MVKKNSVLGLLCTLVPVGFLFACNRSRPTGVVQDGATFDSGGTAHLTRVVPVPSSVSPEAQKWLASLTQQSKSPETLEQRRAGWLAGWWMVRILIRRLSGDYFS